MAVATYHAGLAAWSDGKGHYYCVEAGHVLTYAAVVHACNHDGTMDNRPITVEEFATEAKAREAVRLHAEQSATEESAP